MEGDLTFHTYAYLLHASNSLFLIAKEHAPGSNHARISAVLFSAFAIEAYLNHIGNLKVENWQKLDRLNWRDKMKIIGEKVGVQVDYGKPPFQAVVLIFQFRDRLAHGRTHQEHVSYKFNYVDRQETGHLDPDWLRKYWDDMSVERTLQNVRQIIEKIQAAAGFSLLDLEMVSSGSFSESVDARRIINISSNSSAK